LLLGVSVPDKFIDEVGREISCSWTGAWHEVKVH
jgi:hypothetical protein